MENKSFAELKRICQNNGFSSKGKAFFRVHGDGVLQVMKVEKVRQWPLQRIDLGLFSLYGELMPQWFTSHGCIPRYPIVIFVGKRDVVNLKLIGGNSYRPDFITFEDQLEILEQHTLPFLDRVATQADLVAAMDQLNMLCSGEMIPRNIIWNDELKFAPYLCSGNYLSAARVIQAILDQHKHAKESRKAYMSENEYIEYLASREGEDDELREKLLMAQHGDPATINQYLSANYERNVKYAKSIPWVRRTGDGSPPRE